MKKKIAITQGDMQGIGPEVIVKAIYHTEIRDCCIPFVIGDIDVMAEAVRLTGLPINIREIKSPEEAKADSIDVMHIIYPQSKGRFLKDAVPTQEAGYAVAAYIKKAVRVAMEKKVDAIVTAPISKESLRLAGYPWPGHTELLAELTGVKDYAMMFVGGRLRVILVTIHTALRNVPALITKDAVLKTIRLARRACDMMGIGRQRIAVSGLNPHAGEAGLFGDEEIREITPAIEEAKKEGINVSGPYPPDIVFHKAYRKEVDIIVSMYHDQGLIPLKMIAFDKGVNVTVGLPIIRTSPDHGTAFDIAWKGIASPSSMIEAIKMAVKLSS